VPTDTLSSERIGTMLAEAVVRTATVPDNTLLKLAAEYHVQQLALEVVCLEMFLVDFLVSEVVGANDSKLRAPVLEAFYGYLRDASDDWKGLREAIDPRFAAYAEAMNAPHPQYGRGYPLGRAFAQVVGRPNDLAVIGFAAQHYINFMEAVVPIIRQATR
jgi:hypothetical protein